MRAALAACAIVVGAAGLLVVFLSAKIVPIFAQLFATVHVDLPLATTLLFVIGAARATPLSWLLVGAAAATAACGVRRFAHTPAGSLALDRLRLRLPFAGPLLHKAITARIARVWATFLRAGVEPTATLNAIVLVAGSACYARAFEQVNRALRDGGTLADSLDAARLFDPLFVALVRVGEETGSSDDMLLELADYFERDVAAAIATLGAALEPAIIIVLGGVAGLLVLSSFFKLHSLIGAVAP